MVALVVQCLSIWHICGDIAERKLALQNWHTWLLRYFFWLAIYYCLKCDGESIKRDRAIYQSGLLGTKYFNMLSFF